MYLRYVMAVDAVLMPFRSLAAKSARAGFDAGPDVQWIYCFVIPTYFIYGHTKQEALHPVRSAKLSCLGPRQYYGGGPHGNPRCRRFYFAVFCLTRLLASVEFWGRWSLILGTMGLNFGDDGLKFSGRWV